MNNTLKNTYHRYETRIIGGEEKRVLVKVYETLRGDKVRKPKFKARRKQSRKLRGESIIIDGERALFVKGNKVSYSQPCKITKQKINTK